MNSSKHIANDTFTVYLHIDTVRDIKKLVNLLQSNMHITKLKLCDNNTGDEGAKALAQLANLELLDLSGNKFDTNGNKIGNEGAKALAQLANLTTLSLSWNSIGDEGAKVLAQLANLTTLDLSWNNIGDEGAKALAQLANLTELDLNVNKIGDEGAEALSNGSFVNIALLNLGGNEIGDEGAKALATKLSSIAYLDLNNNKVGDEGAKALAKLSNVQYLDLSWNNIDAEGVKALAEHNNCAHLERNGIGDRHEFFYRVLKKLWCKAREKSNNNVKRLDEDIVKWLFFDLAQRYNLECALQCLLNDPDKYPFLINSKDGEGHTLYSFYTHSPEMQKFLFEYGMIPEQESNQGDEHIEQDSQSVHAIPIVKRTRFFAKKLVESTKVNKEQLKQAATSYVKSIGRLKQYQNDPIRLKLLSLTNNEKRSVIEGISRSDDSIPNDKEFIKAVIDKAEQVLKQEYLRKNCHGEYGQGYPTHELQYDCTRDDAKVTIPESIGRIKLLIDKFSVPLKEKKELLVTLMEQNSELVREKLSIIRKALGNSDIFTKGQFKKAELHGLLSGIDDDKKVNKLFKKISGLDIKKVWREQKEFVLLKQIYIAATTYGENSSACIQGTWTQIISSISEISSEIVAQYDCYFEEEQKREMQKSIITKENIKPFLEGLTNKLIQYVKFHPELKETLEDFIVGIVNINKPEEITFKQQKILVEINRYFSENLKNVFLKNYNRNIPSMYEYGLITEGLSEVKVMQYFVQEPLNLQETSIREVRIQIDEDSSDERDTGEECEDANELIFPEILLIPERSRLENSVEVLTATDQTQNNNQQPSPRNERRSITSIVTASVLAIAGVALGVAAIIIYCDNEPSDSLAVCNVQSIAWKQLTMLMKV